jgi:hypothetical protein
MKKIIFGFVAVAILIGGFIAVNSNKAFAQTSTSSCVLLTRNLTIGSSGADVTSLQSFLEREAYLVMPVGVSKGYFGTSTKISVAKYQNVVGIFPAEGYVGTITRAYINSRICSNPPQSKGVTVTLISTSSVVDENSGQTTSDDTGRFSMRFSVTAPNAYPIYIHKTSALRGTNISSAGFNYLIEDPTNTEVLRGHAIHSVNYISGGDSSSEYLKIDPGQSAVFEISVSYDPFYGDMYRMQLYRINYAITPRPATDYFTPNNLEDLDTNTIFISDPGSKNDRPSMTVISPNGGEIYKKGSVIPFSWKRNNSVEMIQPVVTLFNSNGANVWGSFLENVNTTAVRNEEIPSGIIIPENGGQFKIEVCEYPKNTNNNSYPTAPPVCDSSDGLFSITPSFGTTTSSSSNPQITIEHPNGGEKLVSGQMKPIFWKALNAPPKSTVSLGYRPTDGSIGEMMYPITSKLDPSYGYYDWKVPNVFNTTNSGEFNVFAFLQRDEDMFSVASDSTDRPFTIYAPSSAGAPPTINSFTPSSGRANDTITIYGSGFSSDSKVEFKEDAATRITVTPSSFASDGKNLRFTLSQANIASTTPGNYHLQVVNSKGKSNYSSQMFTLLAPVTPTKLPPIRIPPIKPIDFEPLPPVYITPIKPIDSLPPLEITPVNPGPTTDPVTPFMQELSGLDRRTQAASIQNAISNIIRTNSNYMMGNVRSTLLQLFNQLEKVNGVK